MTRRSRPFMLTWTDVSDAEEVVQVLRSAAFDSVGNIRDRGLYEDAEDLTLQIEMYRSLGGEGDE